MKGTPSGRESGVIALGSLVIGLLVFAAVRHIDQRERSASTLAVCHALNNAVGDYHLRYGVYPVGIRKLGSDSIVGSNTTLTDALLGFRSTRYEEFERIAKRAGPSSSLMNESW